MRVEHLAGTPDAWNFRRFPDACISLGVAPRHVLHVGGHLGQEVEHYRVAGAQRITYMEPNPTSAAYLRQLGPDVHVIEAAAGAERCQAALALCGGDGAWDTLRARIGEGLGVHDMVGALTVDVVPVKDVQADADVLVVDTQGTEVEVLMSAMLCPCAPAVLLVVVETQESGHPEAAHRADVDKIMADRGWEPVLVWYHEYSDRPHATFADVFYQPVPDSGDVVCGFGT